MVCPLFLISDFCTYQLFLGLCPLLSSPFITRYTPWLSHRGFNKIEIHCHHSPELQVHTPDFSICFILTDFSICLISTSTKNSLLLFGEPQPGYQFRSLEASGILPSLSWPWHPSSHKTVRFPWVSLRSAPSSSISSSHPHRRCENSLVP